MIENTYDTVLREIKQEMKKQKISRTAMAKKLGSGIRTFNSYYWGERTMPVLYLFDACKILGIKEIKI